MDEFDMWKEGRQRKEIHTDGGRKEGRKKRRDGRKKKVRNGKKKS